MKRIGFLVFIVSTIIFSSCHKARNTPAESAVAKATVYIDQGDYDFAIQILEDSLLFEENSETRLVLASAYAGRAGIKVENYWDYLIGFDAFAKDKTEAMYPDIIPMNLVPESIDQEAKETLKILNDQYKDLQKLNAKAEKIPVVEPEALQDLMRARSILSKTTSSGSRLYRSLLTAVVVKSEFAEFDKVVKEWIAAEQNFCFSLVAELPTWLADTLDLVSEGLDDLGKAYPDQNADYQSMRTKITETGKKISIDLESNQKITESLCVFQKR
ncbi:MAG: hypothetical protein JNL11_20055 [Bdellovibrionaceae bacterium]|nr:hypothetical protein [Pseudobdellovibrionaceae bacterium]